MLLATICFHFEMTCWKSPHFCMHKSQELFNFCRHKKLHFFFLISPKFTDSSAFSHWENYLKSCENFRYAAQISKSHNERPLSTLISLSTTVIYFLLDSQCFGFSIFFYLFYFGGFLSPKPHRNCHWANTLLQCLKPGEKAQKISFSETPTLLCFSL